MDEQDTECNKISVLSDNSLGLDEIAKTARPIVETVSKLIETLFSSAAKQVGKLVSDQIEAWRFSNRLKIGKGFISKCEAAGVDPAAIPRAFILPAIEAAQDVEDPNLQEMWQNLLSNAAASSEAQQTMFIQTLKSLSAGDANIFNLFASNQPLTGESAGALQRLEALLLLASEFNGERIDRRSRQPRRVYTILDESGEKHQTFLDQPTFGQVQNDRVLIRRSGLRLSAYGRQFYNMVTKDPIINAKLSKESPSSADLSPLHPPEIQGGEASKS